MDSEALRLPLAVGVNVTLTEQLALAASDLPHVVFWAKSPGFVPASVMLEMPRAALPVLLSIMD
jgi:hypothetical protein